MNLNSFDLKKNQLYKIFKIKLLNKIDYKIFRNLNTTWSQPEFKNQIQKILSFTESSGDIQKLKNILSYPEYVSLRGLPLFKSLKLS